MPGCSLMPMHRFDLLVFWCSRHKSQEVKQQQVPSVPFFIIYCKLVWLHHYQRHELLSIIIIVIYLSIYLFYHIFFRYLRQCVMFTILFSLSSTPPLPLPFLFLLLHSSPLCCYGNNEKGEFWDLWDAAALHFGPRLGVWLHYWSISIQCAAFHWTPHIWQSQAEHTARRIKPLMRQIILCWTVNQSHPSDRFISPFILHLGAGACPSYHRAMAVPT